MIARWMFIGLPLWGILTCANHAASLPTLDEALEVSQATGRPILAVAGNET